MDGGQENALERTTRSENGCFFYDCQDFFFLFNIEDEDE